ncbi:hypothetical protein CIL03_18315 [Virgibacillus indicus]|uniref:CTP synthase n=1 Tax=Virgibacillus indicus TaxID=2024554 RepID=A0A265N522_9BACI|nr:DUF6241 domain-containing protein [Virgibacillus indicus]OZU87140.1 hypothetical protein CIL03_18315 [Virgibacillus indicus]
MKKAVIIICILLFIGAIGWGAYSLFGSDQTGNESDKDKDSEMSEEDKAEAAKLQEDREEIKGVITEKDLETFEAEGLNPFGEEKTISELTDAAYQEYIHGMSHQKVKAEKKWGFYEIHPQRVQWLLNGLDQVDLKHENTYQDILAKWKNGNFSTADDDHNVIWNIQGGTVGKATGILSPEEEQEYVESEND